MVQHLFQGLIFAPQEAALSLLKEML